MRNKPVEVRFSGFQKEHEAQQGESKCCYLACIGEYLRMILNTFILGTDEEQREFMIMECSFSLLVIIVHLYQELNKRPSKVYSDIKVFGLIPY